jgi:3-phenylpropionate/trans-cinnamate dioxygenase ferredoxin subunit
MSLKIEIAAERLPPPGGRALLRFGRHQVVLFHTAHGYRAIADSCPHQGASLACGKLDGGAVQCPAHGLRFDLATGAMRGAPGLAVTTYPIELDQGRVTITLPDLEKPSHDPHC